MRITIMTLMTYSKREMLSMRIIGAPSLKVLELEFKAQVQVIMFLRPQLILSLKLLEAQRCHHHNLTGHLRTTVGQRINKRMTVVHLIW